MPEAGQKAMSSREVSNAAPEASETVESDVHQAGLIRKAMMRHSLGLRDVGILILSLLAVFYTLYFAADIVLPSSLQSWSIC